MRCLKKMYCNDFNEERERKGSNYTGNFEEVSRENKRFLEILETQTTKNGHHYVVPLPFKDGDINFLNNRNVAL